MKYRIFTALFLLMCLIPSAGMLVLPPVKAAANEHLSPVPRLCIQGNWNPAVFDEITDYVSDHFALRQQFVTANAVWQTGLLATSPAPDVIYGKNGWLYYAKTLDDYQNHAKLSDEEARQAVQYLAELQNFCQSRGARFLFTIAPNKNSLYPENMPARYLRENALNTHRKMQLLLQEYGIHYADLFSFLSEQEEILYLQTDSHWNNRGAALAHDFLLDTLGLPHTAFADASYTTEPTHTGDLYAMLYPAGTTLEMQQQYTYSFSHVREPRNAEDILIETVNPAAPNGRLIFCRDSFGNALYPFLAEDFQQTIVTRQQPYPLDAVQAGDTVIIEIVERNLPNLLQYSLKAGNKE